MVNKDEYISPIDYVSVSVRHLVHVLLIIYNSMEHVTWKSAGPVWLSC